MPHASLPGILLPLLLALPFSPLAPSPPAPMRGGDEQLAPIVRALEDAPDDVSLLDKAAKTCAALGRTDEAVWYALLALDQLDDTSRGEGKELSAFVASFSPDTASYDQLLESYGESLFRIAQACQRKKLYANAVDLLSHCKGTRFERRAQEMLDKIFSSDSAVQSLLDSGIDIPAKPVTKKSPDWIAHEDKKHATWDDAYQIKGKFYTVVTDMGYEMANSIALAMQQMNSFYRKVFQYKERGGSMRRCVLDVYASRHEFDVHENMADQPGVRGFFRPSQNDVTTYDPRTDGRQLSKLWSTLFHEASHQFITAATSGNEIPTWLDEGTASYFEGAELLPSGLVATNRIPRSRLESLLTLLDRGSPTVEEVVSYFKPGSYPGEYYPFGWGLNYYIQNYEDDKSERIYLPIYAAYLDSYKSGGKHDPLERFTDYFVTRAKVPGVDTFEAFVEHWQKWIRDLGKVYFGGPEQADTLFERARKQRDNGKLEYAVESYRWGLEKRDDAHARFELAEVLAKLGQEDGAVYAYRGVLTAARSSADQDAAMAGFDASAKDVKKLCIDRVAAIDRNVAENLAEADTTFIAATEGLAKKVDGDGLARTAMYLVDSSREVLGGSSALASLEQAISGGVIDLRRWRRAKIDPDLSLWEGDQEWSQSDGEIVLDGVDANLVSFVYRGDVPDTYRYEVRIVPGDAGKYPVYGVVFGANIETGMRMFAALPSAGILGIVALEEGPKVTDALGPMPEVGKDGLLFAVEVQPGHARFFLDGKEVGELDFAPRELRGRVGVCGQETVAGYLEPRLLF